MAYTHVFIAASRHPGKRTLNDGSALALTGAVSPTPSHHRHNLQHPTTKSRHYQTTFHIVQCPGARRQSNLDNQCQVRGYRAIRFLLILTSASSYENAKAMLLTCSDTMMRSSRRDNATASALFSCAFCFDLYAPFGARAFKLTPIMHHCPENMFLLARTPCLMQSSANSNVVVSCCFFVMTLTLSGLRRYGTVRCFMAIEHVP